MFENFLYIDPENQKYHGKFKNWNKIWDQDSAKILNFDFEKFKTESKLSNYSMSEKLNQNCFPKSKFDALKP